MPFTIGLTPCAACKLLRRKCSSDCLFAPHFPVEQAQNFAIVHRVFGAANISKMLQDVLPEQRADAVSSLVYEAQARLRDPVYGTVGAISSLQQRVEELERQLAMAQADALLARMQLPPAQVSCNSCNYDSETWADILRDSQTGPHEVKDVQACRNGGDGGGALLQQRNIHFVPGNVVVEDRLSEHDNNNSNIFKARPYSSYSKHKCTVSRFAPICDFFG